MFEKSKDELKKEMQAVLDREKWQGYVGGVVEGALNVLYGMDIEKNERIQLLSKAAGIGTDTATELCKPREIEYRIANHRKLSSEDKNSLLKLMTSGSLDDDTVMGHPEQTLSMIAAFGGGKFIKDSIPQVKKWTQAGEEVSLSRVKDWLIGKYDLF